MFPTQSFEGGRLRTVVWVELECQVGCDQFRFHFVGTERSLGFEEERSQDVGSVHKDTVSELPVVTSVMV